MMKFLFPFFAICCLNSCSERISEAEFSKRIVPQILALGKINLFQFQRSGGKKISFFSDEYDQLVYLSNWENQLLEFPNAKTGSFEERKTRNFHRVKKLKDLGCFGLIQTTYGSRITSNINCLIPDSLKSKGEPVYHFHTFTSTPSDSLIDALNLSYINPMIYTSCICNDLDIWD